MRRDSYENRIEGKIIKTLITNHPQITSYYSRILSVRMGGENTNQNADKKSFGRDVGKLVTGTIVAQAVGICLMPIITRIFGPDIYGVASVFISIVSILTVVSCMRYELAILLPKEQKEAGGVFLACLGVLLCFTIVLIPVFLFFGDRIVNLFNAPELSSYVLLIPLLVFIDGLYLALRYWNTRNKRFGTQAATQALQSITGNGCKLGLGFAGQIHALSLILAQIMGQLLGTIILLIRALRTDFVVLKNSFSLLNIKTQMTRYRKFPLIDTWSNLMNVISWQLPVLMLSGFFSPAIAGLYTLGFQMIQMPMSFIGGSIRQVFLQRGAVAKHDGTLSHLTEEICSVLIMLAVMPFLLLGIVGGDLFGLVFGAEWYEAGVFAQILALWAMIWFVASIMSELIYVMEYQGFGFFYNVLNLSTRFLSLLIGGIVGNVYLGLFLFMASGVFVYGFMGYVVVRCSGGSFAVIWRNVRKAVLVSAAGAGVVLCLSLSGVFSGWFVCVAAVGVGVGYVGWLVLKEKRVREYLGCG